MFTIAHHILEIFFLLVLTYVNCLWLLLLWAYLFADLDCTLASLLPGSWRSSSDGAWSPPNSVSLQGHSIYLHVGDANIDYTCILVLAVRHRWPPPPKQINTSKHHLFCGMASFSDQTLWSYIFALTSCLVSAWSSVVEVEVQGLLTLPTPLMFCRWICYGMLFSKT